MMWVLVADSVVNKCIGMMHQCIWICHPYTHQGAVLQHDKYIYQNE